MQGHALVHVLGDLTKNFATEVRSAVQNGSDQIFIGCTDIGFIGCDAAARAFFEKIMNEPEALRSNHKPEDEPIFDSLEHACAFSKQRVRPFAWYIVIDVIHHGVKDIVRSDGTSLLDPKNDQPYRPTKSFIDQIMERKGMFLLKSMFATTDNNRRPVYHPFKCECKEPHAVFFATKEIADAVEQKLRFEPAWNPEGKSFSLFHVIEITDKPDPFLRGILDPRSLETL